MVDAHEGGIAALPDRESERLALLDECRILDTPADPDFDDLTRIAAQICGTPIALISLIDETRQWFKSRHGLDTPETPRHLAFCAHAILNPTHLLVVPDATQDPRFSANELVTGPLGIRFYAGAPLVVEDGHALGSLCVIDQRPRELTAEQSAALVALARQVVSQIQLRRQNFALREARIEREAFFTRPLDMLCMAGADGYFKALNPAFTETLGFTSEELLAVPLFDFVHPDDVASTHAEMAHVLNGSPAVNFEHRFRCKDGGFRWLSWKCAPSPDGVLYASARDVTEQKRLQETLQQQRNELEQFFTLPLDMLCVAKTDGYFKLLNPAFSEILGFTTAELLAVPFLSLLHPDDVAGTLAEIERLNQGKLTVDFENRYRCKDGTYRWLSWKCSPTVDGLIYASARDVSERKETEARLRSLSEFQRAILDSADYGVIATTPEGVITVFNPAAQRMLGYAAEEVVGRTTPAIFHAPEEVAARAVEFREELGGALLEPGFEVFVAKSRRHLPNEHQWTYLHKDGRRFPVQLSVTALRDGPEGIVGFLGIAIDITERLEAENRLKASLHEKETLLKEVHHRVKNNLQVITSLLQLQSASLHEPALLALFREAQDRVRAMALIHEGLYRSGNLAAVDFGSHVRELVKTLLRSYACNSGPVRLAAETESVHLDIDVAVPLSLIVNELVTNAFKYAFAGGRGGVLELIFRAREDGLLLLSVGDDGPGLAEDFDIARTSTLGLKIVRTLTGQVGGTLAVKPRPGTTFTIVFPRSRGIPATE